MPLTSRNQVGHVVELSMQSGPANLFDMPLCQALLNDLRELEADPTVGAVVLHSGLANIFSGGVDLNYFYPCDRDKFRIFWSLFQQLFHALYTSRLVVIFAVNGHNFAGGCVMSLTADYRIVVADEKTRCGMNEVSIGLCVPRVVTLVAERLIGARQAERLCMGGYLLSPSEMLQVGLCDELCASKADLLVAAHRHIARVAPHMHNQGARALTKHYLRNELGTFMKDKHDFLIEELLAMLQEPATQAIIGKAHAMINRSKKGKANL